MCRSQCYKYQHNTLIGINILFIPSLMQDLINILHTLNVYSFLHYTKTYFLYAT